MQDRRSGVGRIIVLIVVLILVAILILNPTLQGMLREFLLFDKNYPEEVTMTMERTFVVGANGGTIVNYSLDIPIPDNLEYGGNRLQQVMGIDIDPPETSSVQKYGNSWKIWEGGSMQGTETFTVTITYEMKMSTVVWDYEDGQVDDRSEIPAPLKDNYLGDEWEIIVSDPDVQSKAQQIVGNETNVKVILKSIFDWVIDNVDYPLVTSGSEPQNSTETLHSLEGDCDDQAILFCSLARAVGVPAWLHLGVLYDPVLDRWGGHGWVETYIPLKEGGGKRVVIDTVNEDFMVWGPNRFVEFIDDGNETHLEDYYQQFHSSYYPSTYPSGGSPTFDVSFEALDYQESGDRIFF